VLLALVVSSLPNAPFAALAAAAVGVSGPAGWLRIWYAVKKGQGKGLVEGVYKSSVGDVTTYKNLVEGLKGNTKSMVILVRGETIPNFTHFVAPYNYLTEQFVLFNRRVIYHRNIQNAPPRQ
jgi:hypothetical protein